MWYYLGKHNFVKLKFICLAGALGKSGAILRTLGSPSLEFWGKTVLLHFIKNTDTRHVVHRYKRFQDNLRTEARKRHHLPFRDHDLDVAVIVGCFSLFFVPCVSLVRTSYHVQMRCYVLLLKPDIHRQGLVSHKQVHLLFVYLSDHQPAHSFSHVSVYFLRRDTRKRDYCFRGSESILRLLIHRGKLLSDSSVPVDMAGSSQA